LSDKVEALNSNSVTADDEKYRHSSGTASPNWPENDELMDIFIFWCRTPRVSPFSVPAEEVEKEDLKSCHAS